MQSANVGVYTRSVKVQTTLLNVKCKLITTYNIHFLPHIYSGAFSEVRVATNKLNNEKVAIKKIDKTQFKGREMMLYLEVEIFKRVKHENIIRLHEVYEDLNEICLVMDLLTGGELFDEIIRKGKFKESESSRIVYKILKAIDYLHDMGIVHRDLKV